MLDIALDFTNCTTAEQKTNAENDDVHTDLDETRRSCMSNENEMENPR